MISMEPAGFAGGAALATGLDLGRGAIIGALFVGTAYLAGYAVLRRSPAAACALAMVLAAAALQFGSLGFFPEMPSKALVMLQGVFGAAAIVYLSSVVKLARNAFVGGLMLAAALTFVGLGAINILGRGDASGLMRNALFGVGLLAAILSVVQWRKDPAARLLLPGVILAMAAPFAGGLTAWFGDGFSLAPHALFAIGVIAASLVALTEESRPRIDDLGLHVHGHAHSHNHDHHHHDAAMTASGGPRECEADLEHDHLCETKLARVADYAGVAVWDWCPHGAHQTEGMAAMMGADSRAPFTPEAVKAFIHKDDAAKLEQRVLAGSLGDGAFDLILKLHDGRHVRFRGARAVDGGGALERIVAFIDSVPEPTKMLKASAPPALLTYGGVAKGAAAPLQHNNLLAGAFPEALSRGDIKTVFQPIVSLDGGKVAGYEALARWPGKGGEADRGAEELVRAAEASGKGGALARVVLEDAAQHLAKEMKAQGRRDLFVAVNLSFVQMREPGFPSALKRVSADYGLPAKSVVLELTESQAISEKAGAAEIFKALKDAGAALAFDDFGAGFSSLNNLRKYAFDYLKIDKSFIDGLTRGNESGKIAQSIAALGRDLGLTVIAEGVETKATAEAARKIGCTLGQGYAFGAPGKAEPEPAFADPRNFDRKPKRSMWRGDLR